MVIQVAEVAVQAAIEPVGGGGSFVINGAQKITNSLYVPLSGINSGGEVLTSTVFGTLVLRPTRIYVKDNSSGANDGTSWVNAFKSLQDALTASLNNCLTEIWVASGTYFPDEGAGITDNDRALCRCGIRSYV